MQPGTATAAFSDSIVYGYNSFLGLSIARDAVAYFLAKRFYRPDQAATMTPQMALSLIDPEHIAIGSGCAGILNQLFFSLGEDGDACLIPAPYYAAFEKDMSVRENILDTGLFGYHRRLFYRSTPGDGGLRSFCCAHGKSSTWTYRARVRLGIH